MKVVEREGFLRAISKAISLQDALGVSIDLYKLSGSAGDAFFSKCREYIYEKQELSLWTEVAINDILASHSFVALPVSGKWYEIDTLEDLAEAEKLFTI